MFETSQYFIIIENHKKIAENCSVDAVLCEKEACHRETGKCGRMISVSLSNFFLKEFFAFHVTKLKAFIQVLNAR